MAQQTTTPVPVGELWERKAELLYALERLRPLGTNLHDAVSFYLTHQGSPTGEKLWSEVVEQFLSEKLRIGRSPQYDRNMRQSLTRFISLTGGDRSIGTITRQQITDYVYRTNAKLTEHGAKQMRPPSLAVRFDPGALAEVDLHLLAGAHSSRRYGSASCWTRLRTHRFTGFIAAARGEYCYTSYMFATIS